MIQVKTGTPWRRAIPLAVIACAALMVTPALAADWPSRPIRIVVPSSPGGGTDVMARVVGQKLAESLKVSVVIDNRPGGEELIGADLVAKAPPDGYTILIAAANVAVNPVLRRTMPYAVKDLRTIAVVAKLPYVILVNAKLPIHTVPELVEYSKKQAKGLNLANGGTSNQLASESFRMATGSKMTTIPYKGCAPSIMSVLAGETDLTFCSAPAAVQSVTAGKLTALAVTGDSRLSILPGVPTTKELGDRRFQVDLVQWHGVLVPADTPNDIVQRLNAEINKALLLPDVIEKARLIGGVTQPLSVEESARFFENELAVSKRVIEQANITSEN